MKGRWLVLAALIVGACLPEREQEHNLVDSVQILAVRAVPAEAAPGDEVYYEALVASPSGLHAGEVGWAYCSQSRTVKERTGVTASCAEGRDLEPVAAETRVPMDACARFGPNPPPNGPDEQPRRPADPDPTGGYYLPIRAQLSDSETGVFGFQRIRCDLAGATRSIFEEFQERYSLNRHPQISRLAMAEDENGEGIGLALGVASVQTGAVVRFVLEATANSTESFVVYDRENSRVVDKTETLYATWYVTAGTLGLATSSGSHGGFSSEQTWQAPSEAMTVLGWVVLRDSRGGMDWHEFRVNVQQ